MLMNHFTPEDLVQYLYKETPAALTRSIEEALRTDWTLREKLAVLKAAQQRLDTLAEAPRTETVLNILRYARKTERETPE